MKNSITLGLVLVLYGIVLIYVIARFAVSNQGLVI